MSWLLWVLLGILALIIIFLVGPVIVATLSIFSHMDCVPLDRQDLSDTYFADHIPRIRAELRYLDGLPFRQVQLTAPDGTELVGEYCPGEGRRLVIFFHGYMSCGRNNFFCQAADLYRQGFDVLLVNQRGHGPSGGRTTMGLKESRDVSLWINWAEKQAPDRSILLYGVSMGAATLSYASAGLGGAVKAMVLDSGFLCPFDMLLTECDKRSLPGRPMLFLVCLMTKLLWQMDIRDLTTDYLSKTKIPALFLYGTGDETVAEQHVRQAYESCASEKELVTIDGAAHTIAYLVGGQHTKDLLQSFVDRHLN